MSDDLLTVQLTTKQARALHWAAAMFSEGVGEMCPEWTSHIEDGEVPALTSGILALEMTLACGAES
jgi:hypothetical protein